MLNSRPLTVLGAVAVACLVTICHPTCAQWDVAQAQPAVKTYNDPQGRFSVQIPSAWTAEQKAESLVFRWENAAATALCKSEPSDAQKLAAAVVERVRSVASDYVEVKKADAVLAKTPGVRLDFTAKGPKGENTRGFVIAVADKSIGFTVLLTAPVAEFDSASLQLDSALATLTFGAASGPQTVKLSERTRIKVTILEGLSSSSAKKGEEVRYEVVDDVVGPNREVLIAKGSSALGSVTRAAHRGIFGKPGKLNISIDFVRAVDGTKVPLRANEDMSVRGRNNSSGAAAATLLIAPIGLLINGRDVRIKKGAEFVVYVDADTLVDLSKAKPRAITSP